MNIGILGGSFNPPHLGHLFIAQQVLQFTDIEKIWLMPCYQHSFDKTLAAPFHRIAMARMLETENIMVSTLEIEHELNGETINLVPLLKQQYPNDIFTFIIGSDQLSMFTKWSQWERLLQELSFLVVPRAGYPLAPLFTGMEVLESELLVITNISSSLIRNRLQRGISIEHIVPKEIIGYIRKHNLYELI